jgi:hypothetical protein
MILSKKKTVNDIRKILKNDIEKISILPLIISATGIVPQSFFKNLKILNLENTLVVEIQNSILSIKNGNDNVRIEDNCLEEELATTPILSEIRTLSLTFVMLMRFFARLNIYYKTFLTKVHSKIKKPPTSHFLR